MSTILFDPRQAPIDALADEPALDLARLELDWLRNRFIAPGDWQAEFTDEHLLRDPARALTPAAVLVPLVAHPEGMRLLLTKRTAHLHDHAGQISFPGGRVDPEDQDEIATALRETEEEIGLARRHIEVIGRLPDYLTGTGFQVTPVVALVHPPFELLADTFEVAEIFTVPLAYLMNGAHHERRSAEFPNRPGRRSFYAMPYEDYFIWGATAGMLRNLYHFLRA
ncbi:MAG: CoA pyrophosphatase [Burkholderiaceae bacterium]